MKGMLLIGGNSGAGKTTLAKSLGDRFDLSCVHLDGFAQEVKDPNLVFYTGEADFWERPPEELLRRLVGVAERTVPYLQALVTYSAAEGRSTIVEGEKVHPRFVEWTSSLSYGKGLFLIEENAEFLHQSLAQRSSRFNELPAAQQRKVVEVNRRYGAWLRSEAERRHLTWMPARPQKSLISRVIERLER